MNGSSDKLFDITLSFTEYELIRIILASTYRKTHIIPDKHAEAMEDKVVAAIPEDLRNIIIRKSFKQPSRYVQRLQKQRNIGRVEPDLYANVETLVKALEFTAEDIAKFGQPNESCTTAAAKLKELCVENEKLKRKMAEVRKFIDKHYSVCPYVGRIARIRTEEYDLIGRDLEEKMPNKDIWRRVLTAYNEFLKPLTNPDLAFLEWNTEIRQLIKLFEEKED